MEPQIEEAWPVQLQRQLKHGEAQSHEAKRPVRRGTASPVLVGSSAPRPQSGRVWIGRLTGQS